MTKLILALALVLQAFAAAHANESKPNCTSATIHSIKRPIDPNKQDSRQFDYKFEILPGNRGNSTVIFLPGGPGETSIGSPRAVLHVPDTFSLVNTDPRGTGCNSIPVEEVNPERFYDSTIFASDVLEIIRFLNTRGDRIVLFGASYGTVLATHVAELAEKEIPGAVSAVVLDGVIGRSFTPAERIESIFAGVSQYVSTLTEPAQSSLLDEAAPFGIRGDKWFSFIFSMGYTGEFPNQVDGVKDIINQILDPNADQRSVEPIRRGIVGSAQAPGQNPTDLFRQVQCREIISNAGSSTSIKTFGLERFKAFQQSLSEKSDLCKGIPSDRTFDSKRFQIRTPLFYFSRQTDMATPLWQAFYHFDHQQYAILKELVVVAGRGHADIVSNYLESVGCSKAVWDAILNIQSLKTVLSKCSGSYDIRE